MPFPQRGIMNNGILPNHSSAIKEKLHYPHHSDSWTKAVLLPIPGVRSRRLRILVPNITTFSQLRGARVRRTRAPVVLCFACLALVLTVIFVSRIRDSRKWSENWPPSTGDASTLVFRRDDLQRIWKWEIASGHFPSRQTIPRQIGLKTPPVNPAVPYQGRSGKSSRYRSPAEELDTDTYGVGPKRVYIDNQSLYPNVAYPPRPIPGSVADMDIIMKYCDFSTGKYVRDCLEILRLGGGLDNGRRIRRGKTDAWQYIFKELKQNSTESTYDVTPEPKVPQNLVSAVDNESDPDAGLIRKRGSEWEEQVVLPEPLSHRPSASSPEPCDPEIPRVYHMFWTGPFTDKPYLALLSFLFTQNTGMHLREFPKDSPVCRPQFWMWINPGPAASVPNPTALRDMYTQLKSSPWASPFLHPRFKDVIQFKLWNTTEQLDGIPEIKDEWRKLKDTLFNSGGHVISVPVEKKKESTTISTNGNETVATSTRMAEEEDLLNRTGSKSSSSYDRLSVILSDMARFILCHRFGGIYLDADTIFLRDWEEIWGWKGAFAYRWSRLEKYNTAVLRMHKGSALGTFLFRTALKNGLDFHPMTVSLYTADAHLEGLLLRLPDAMFDSAWLNTEHFQRDRPPQPYFTEFADFFNTPAQNSAAPQALGFDGFFKGAYSYHFHNFWWKPFDPTRNWPDLGVKFKAGEDLARAALDAAANVTSSTASEQPNQDTADPFKYDKRDLDWSAVLKRTFESYIRGERPNMYGEWLQW